MSIWNKPPQLASEKELDEILLKLDELDKDNMLNDILQMPHHIQTAFRAAEKYNEGDIPLDNSKIYLLGMGGSAIAGDLINDLLSPYCKLQVFRGTPPPRDKRGVVASSYSGNTREVLDLLPAITGGLKSSICLTSGGRLANIAWRTSLPIWKMPGGYQPRAALGWSIGLLMAVMVKWRIVHLNVMENLRMAAYKLTESLKQHDGVKHPLIKSSLPLAQELKKKTVLVFYSPNCKGAARRLTTQINENSKNPGFAVPMPEGLHNCVEGLTNADPESYAIVFISDPADTDFLRESMDAAADQFLQRGFSCIPLPVAGSDQFERTLSRLLISDFVSLFLSVYNEVDPTELPTISAIKTTLYGPEAPPVDESDDDESSEDEEDSKEDDESDSEEGETRGEDEEDDAESDEDDSDDEDDDDDDGDEKDSDEEEKPVKKRRILRRKKMF